MNQPAFRGLGFGRSYNSSGSSSCETFCKWGSGVGVARFGSSTDFTLRYIIPKACIDADKDVPILQRGGQPELAAAMETRRIFAAPLTPGGDGCSKVGRLGPRS